jgi:TPR repeat protein
MDFEEEYCAAIELYDNEDFEAAFAKFFELAAKDHPHAISVLAIMYSHGQFVEKDVERSIALDLRAIALGNSTSISNLATTYLQNNNPPMAKEWFRKAVDAGDGDALVELAKLKIENANTRSEAKRLLQQALAHSCITPDSVEQAELLLRHFEGESP